MHSLNLLAVAKRISSLPRGTRNVRSGLAIVGSAGRWVPCSAQLPSGGFVPCVFEVGAGRHQVCADATPLVSEELAFQRAQLFAQIASGDAIKEVAY